MNIRPEDSKKFPDLAVIIQRMFFTVARKPKLKDALERYAGGPYALAIMYPQGPTVRIDPDFFQCEEDGPPQLQPDGTYVQKFRMKAGFTPPSATSNEIYVAPDIAQNAGTTDGRLMAEATLLHECVHWCRLIDDKDVWSEKEPYAFETAAYGKVMGRSYYICPAKKVVK